MPGEYPKIFFCLKNFLRWKAFCVHDEMRNLRFFCGTDGPLKRPDAGRGVRVASDDKLCAVRSGFAELRGRKAHVARVDFQQNSKLCRAARKRWNIGLYVFARVGEHPDVVAVRCFKQRFSRLYRVCMAKAERFAERTARCGILRPNAFVVAKQKHIERGKVCSAWNVRTAGQRSIAFSGGHQVAFKPHQHLNLICIAPGQRIHFAPQPGQPGSAHAIKKMSPRMLADRDAAEALFNRGKDIFFRRALAVTVIRVGMIIGGYDHFFALACASCFCLTERATRMMSRFSSEIMVMFVSRPMMVLKSSSREVQKKKSAICAAGALM